MDAIKQWLASWKFPDKPSIPDALCDDLSRFVKQDALKVLREQLVKMEAQEVEERHRTFKERMVANHREMIAEYEIAAPHLFDFRRVAMIIPKEEAAAILRKHGITVASEAAVGPIVANLPACARDVEVGNAIANVKRKIEAGSYR